ncbi:MAG: hypothetical protein ACJ72V_06580 [Nitrososphaeraceae archaeon]
MSLLLRHPYFSGLSAHGLQKYMRKTRFKKAGREEQLFDWKEIL